MRCFLQLQYDGTGFHGWQKLKDYPTVQNTLEEALARILRRPVRCHGCGRTDAGVHAMNYYAHLDLETSELPNLVYRLNRLLPPAILVRELFKVPPDAHAQRDALERVYRYQVCLEKDPFLHPYSFWYQPSTFDTSILHALAKQVSGTHDFGAFCKTPTRQIHTISTIFHSHWSRNEGSRYVFEISGNRFARGMIRLLVGNMLEVASGNLSALNFQDALFNQKRLPFFKMVPPGGLHLVTVKYPYLDQQDGYGPANT
jgi:tRNA pseudouridine38-40 synthase